MLKSGWESIVVAVPFVLVMLAVIFRLDQLLAAPRGKKSTMDPALNRPPCGVDKNGRIMLTDPDGRPWGGDRGPK